MTRQPDGEGRSLAFDTFYADGAAVNLDGLPGKSQSQARSPDVFDVGAALEVIEDHLKLIRRDADALILHGKRKIIVFWRTRQDQSYIQAIWRILHRVGDQ